MTKKNGFSLIEILIVLGILGTLAVFAVRPPKNPQKEFQRFFRRFSLMSKKIRNQALLENSTYRIVFLLNDKEAPKIWVEKTPRPILLGTEKESREKFKELLKNFQNKEKNKGNNKIKNNEGFKKARKFSFQKLKMPKNLKINQIEISGIDYPIREGLGVFHYFPHGLVEETSIQFTNLDGSYKITMISDSISGELYTVKDHKSLEELQDR